MTFASSVAPCSLLQSEHSQSSNLGASIEMLTEVSEISNLACNALFFARLAYEVQDRSARRRESSQPSSVRPPGWQCEGSVGYEQLCERYPDRVFASLPSGTPTKIITPPFSA